MTKKIGPYNQNSTVKWTKPLAKLFAAVLAVVVQGTSLKAQTVQQITSSQGIRTWLVEEHSLPLVAIRFSFEGGSLQDPDGKEGLTEFLSEMLSEGAGDLQSQVFKDRLEGIAASFSASVSRSTISGEMVFLRKYLKGAIDLLELIVNKPRFEPEATERIRKKMLTNLAFERQEPRIVAQNNMLEMIFPGHPYSRNPGGSIKSVQNITHDDLVNHHRKVFAKQSLRVVVVGDVDKDTVNRLADQVFSMLPDDGELKTIVPIKPRAAKRYTVVEKDVPLATAVFSTNAPLLDEADFMAALVLNHVLGSGDFDAVLTNEIRVKRGLTYSIGTRIVADKITSFMLGTFATKNENMDRAIKVVEDVFIRMANEGPGRDSIENAKSNLTGSYLLRFDTSSKITNLLMNIWLDGNGPEYLTVRNQKINQVTLDHVKRVAKSMLRKENLFITIVGKPAMIE